MNKKTLKGSMVVSPVYKINNKLVKDFIFFIEYKGIKNTFIFRIGGSKDFDYLVKDNPNNLIVNAVGQVFQNCSLMVLNEFIFELFETTLNKKEENNSRF
jgi:hypothetical protein